MHIQLQLFRQ